MHWKKLKDLKKRAAKKKIKEDKILQQQKQEELQSKMDADITSNPET